MNLFEDTLSYCSPAHGGYGIIRMAAMVPESYQLFVCPSACFRHGSLGAIQHGYKNQISYLYIEQTDIVNGYDNVISEGIDELMARLTKKIRVLFVYVSCLDDFIGTDLEKVLMKAQKKYPDVIFRAGHMNPIASSTKKPPMATTMDAVCSVLPVWKEKDDGVSLYGNFFPISQKSEFIRMMHATGHEVRQIGHCGTFDEYAQLSRSRYGILDRSYASLAFSNMKLKHELIPARMYQFYDLESIDRQYDDLSKVMKWNDTDFLKKERDNLIHRLKNTKEKIGNMPILVSDSATFFPFNMAYALLQADFNVAAVYAQQAAGLDAPWLEKVQKEYPQVKIIQADHPNLYMHSPESFEGIAIGEEAAYLTNAKHVVNLSEDDGMLGYYGLERLLTMMQEASDTESDVQKLIEEYGGIV